ncbi:MAG: ATP-dependent DNA helicase RecG [Lachnospiraceae bacterium]|nr:ATP-dependent DNA helicase RecG [Lachnospiraceae bacterium]
MNFSDDITTIKGVGDKTSAAFKRIGVDTVNDLVHTFPRNYLTYDEVVDIGQAKMGERVAVMAVISSYVDVRTVRSLKLTNISVKDSTGTLKITWFNSPYLKNVLHKGDTYVFVGTIKIKNNSRVMDMPEYYRPNVYEGMRQVMQPVYPLTHGLSNKMVMKAVAAVRPLISSIKDYMPEEVRKEFDLTEQSIAYDTVHYPVSEQALRLAIKRLAFDEFYQFLADMGRLRVENIKQQNIHKIVQGKAVAEFVGSLPYSLTKGQAEAIDDILKDMGSENVMNRLVQGDVGSGKTIVAEAALFACVKEGYQGALMVPTEVLAKQHYEELCKTLEPYDIRVECLVGSTPLKDKRRIYENIRHGMTDILIGTHALIEDKVDFLNLGLVVTDEQHRFGVEQRKKLANKGTFPHVLVMSATPIPRTLAIIMYADLDISVISQLPKGRKPIKNCVVGTGYRATAYNFIASQVKEQGQVYVICPMVNDSETLDVTNVTDYTDTLKQSLGQNVRVCMLHGQMKAAEKNEIMEDFLQGNIDVLVSTTVIEVGINNPNATVMMVENAERFGLAQLHQLRGRVGRGKKQSYCIFIDGKESQESQERLKVLENSNDGFFIANEDLKLRGPGDFFGIRQSGEVLFTLADIYNHADMLKLAQDAWNKYGETLLDGDRPVGNLESTVL